MKAHTKKYMDYFGYDVSDFIPSEISGVRANDIHHIEARQMGGTKEKDSIENLMALTREEHLLYGDKQQFKDWLKQIHLNFMGKYSK